jgi:F-type H+-transporting ATPase subunit delta
MSVSKIAGRYAKALMDMAIEKGQVESVVNDMKTFQGVALNREFQLVLKSPIISAVKKSNIFKALFEEQFNPISMAFVNLVLTKGREEAMSDIANEFMDQYKIMQQITTVTLTTAVPMDEASVESVRQKMMASVHTSANIEMETVVDPSIIGGFVLSFDGKSFDSSVKQQLHRLKDKFDDNEYVSQVVAK